MNINVYDLQRLLSAHGYSVGSIDGIMGRRTVTALQQFLVDRGHPVGRVDGIMGPKTRVAFAAFQANTDRQPKAATGNLPTADHPLPWMAIAYDVMGLHETRDNAALKRFLRSDGGTVGDPARIAWCGDFVHTCIRLGLPNEPFTGRVRENPYLAMNWAEDFGVPCEPTDGAVLSFWRGSPDSIYGHVAFYVGEDDRHYFIQGGNQKNSVSVTKIEKRRLRKHGCRWPVTSPVPPAGPRFMEMDLALSVNEA